MKPEKTEEMGSHLREVGFVKEVGESGEFREVGIQPVEKGSERGR